jgi:predicted amidohydrolase YtcJ
MGRGMKLLIAMGCMIVSVLEPAVAPEVRCADNISPDEFSRFKKLNITAEMSPTMFFTHPVTEMSGGLMDWNFVKMLEAGAHVTIGSDWGVPEDPSPFPAMASIVEKVGGGDVAKGGEILCRMLTLAGAEAVGAEKTTGSIEVGKKANFIALDRDLSKGEFGDIRVLKTWFEGDLVWDMPRTSQ